MNPAVIDRFFAMITLAGAAGAIALVIWWKVSSDGLRRTVGSLLFPLVAVVAVGAMGGSLLYSEVFERIPCSLCWFQRIFMYPIAFISTIGLIRRDRGILPYTGTLAIFGGVISAAHVLEQNTSWFSSPVCLENVPCSIKYVNEFGFVSTPVMALCCFILIAVASFIASAITKQTENA